MERRDFLKWLGLGGLSLALPGNLGSQKKAGAKAAPRTPGQKFDRELAGKVAKELDGLMQKSSVLQSGLEFERLELLSPHISEHAKINAIPEALLAGLIWAESGGSSAARSGANARGPMQLMPTKARDLGMAVSTKGKSTIDFRLRPEESVKNGAKHLRELIETFKDLRIALAAYNAGETRLGKLVAGGKKWEQIQEKLPEETRDYVARVLARAQVYADPHFDAHGFVFSGKPTYKKLFDQYCKWEEGVEMHSLEMVAGKHLDLMRFLNPHIGNPKTVFEKLNFRVVRNEKLQEAQRFYEGVKELERPGKGTMDYLRGKYKAMEQGKEHSHEFRPEFAYQERR